MQVTVSQLKEWFVIFNKRYFEGKLPEPQFAVGRSRTRLGSLSWKSQGRLPFFRSCVYTIRLSNYYDVSEKDFQNVLLHEMIHLCIESQHLKDTSPHGVVFRRYIKLINADGWNISVTGKSDPAKRSKQPAKRCVRVVLAATTKDGRHILSVVNPAYAHSVDRALRRATDVVSFSWHASSDDYFAPFPAVRTPRGRIVSTAVFQDKMALLTPLDINSH